MRRLFAFAVTFVLLLAGCSGSPEPLVSEPVASAGSVSPSPDGPARTSPAATIPPEGVGPGTGDPDDSGRYAYVCTSLRPVPDVKLSSLAEVWASPGYLRLRSCTALYEGPEPFVPTEGEAAIIAIAEPGTPPAEGLEAFLSALELCTRVSDEAASDVFGGSSRQLLLAASKLCPKAPQGQILALWAEGARAGDGEHQVGESGLSSGTFHLRKTPPQECTWTIETEDGRARASGGPAEGQAGITLDEGEVLNSKACGIWERIP